MFKPNDLVVSKKGNKPGRILREYLPGRHTERLYYVKFDWCWNDLLAWESDLKPARSMLVKVKVDIL